MMNAACSTCLGSFTIISDISSTPCGHVFHTDCIKKWLQNGQNSCMQCRKKFEERQIIKLYFSASESESSLVMDLEEANGRSLKFQKENSELQEEIQRLTKLLTDQNGRSLNFQNENSELRQANQSLTKHLLDMKSNSDKIEKSLKQKCKELTVEVEMAKVEVESLKQNCEDLTMEVELKEVEAEIAREDTSLIQESLFNAIYDNDVESCKKILDNAWNKNPKDHHGSTPLHLAAIFGCTGQISSNSVE